MKQPNAADELETSFEEVRRLELSAKLSLTAEPPHGEELRHLDEWLAGYKELNDFYRKKNERLQRIWQQELDKKEASINALQREKDNMYTILISSKANYFEELVDAERKIKNLENECSQMKIFLTRDLLIGIESTSASIRNRYGDDKAMVLSAAKMNFGPVTLTGTAEHISAPVATAQIEPVPAILPAENVATGEAEQPSTAPEPSTSQEASTSQQQSAGDVIEITDDEQAIEQNEERMETDEANLLNRFPCEHCSRSFDTLAEKYRHETRTHDATHAIEQQPEKVKQGKSPFKQLKRLQRLQRMRRLAKEKQIREGILMRRLLLSSFIEASSTPVKRNKKTADK